MEIKPAKKFSWTVSMASFSWPCFLSGNADRGCHFSCHFRSSHPSHESSPEPVLFLCNCPQRTRAAKPWPGKGRRKWRFRGRDGRGYHGEGTNGLPCPFLGDLRRCWPMHTVAIYACWKSWDPNPKFQNVPRYFHRIRSLLLVTLQFKKWAKGDCTQYNSHHLGSVQNMRWLIYINVFWLVFKGY